MTTPGNDFLSEGAKSYLDALTAIEAFEGRARGVCKSVYEKYKTQLVSKMGIEDAGCEDHENKDPANGFAELGVWQSTRSEREWFYVYLRWDGPEISACVCMEFSKRNDRDDYAKLLRKIPAIQPGDDDGSHYLWSHKNLSDLSSSAEILGELLNEWLACWPSAGD